MKHLWNISPSNIMQLRILIHQYKDEKAFLARFNRGFRNNVYNETPFGTQCTDIAKTSL